MFLLYQDKRNRGFAAYEARQGGVVGFFTKKRIFLPLMPRWQILLNPKVFKRFRAYPMQPYPQANSQNTATTGLAHLKRCANKINAFATHRLSIAVFLSVAGYSPVRTIKDWRWGKECCLFRGNAFNHSLVLLMVYISQ